MRRWVKTIAVCLALGAVTTVVVAWGCWLRATWPRNGNAPLEDFQISRIQSPGYWDGRGSRTIGYAVYFLVSEGSSACWIEYPPLEIDHEPSWVGEWLKNDPTELGPPPVAAAGWPALCLGAVSTYQTRVSSYAPSIPLWTKTINTGYSPFSERLCLPLRPLLAGLLIDIGFFSAIWFVPLGVIPMIRRARRHRRGLCPACAYDLRNLSAARCPECGGATIPSSPCTTPPSQPA